MIGLLYFIVIVLANTLGAIAGMGGGVIIKPVLDFIGADSVAAVSFYSTVAVFTMSFVSTLRQVQSGNQLNWRIVAWSSAGAVIGGIVGNQLFELFLQIMPQEETVKLIQIVLTILSLVFALLYARFDWQNYTLQGAQWYLLCGLVLGFLASFLGIGGGPINVSLFMLLFSMPIKEATIYSIATIFFSQLAKIVTILSVTGVARYDLKMLYYVIPAAIIGGLLGAQLSHVLSPKKVMVVFQLVIILVIVVNLYNGYQVIK